MKLSKILSEIKQLQGKPIVVREKKYNADPNDWTEIVKFFSLGPEDIGEKQVNYYAGIRNENLIINPYGNLKFDFELIKNDIQYINNNNLLIISLDYVEIIQ